MSLIFQRQEVGVCSWFSGVPGSETIGQEIGLLSLSLPILEHPAHFFNNLSNLNPYAHVHPGQCEFYGKNTHNSRGRRNICLDVISLRKRLLCLLEVDVRVCACVCVCFCCCCCFLFFLDVCVYVRV